MAKRKQKVADEAVAEAEPLAEGTARDWNISNDGAYLRYETFWLTTNKTADGRFKAVVNQHGREIFRLSMLESNQEAIEAAEAGLLQIASDIVATFGSEQ